MNAKQNSLMATVLLLSGLLITPQCIPAEDETAGSLPLLQEKADSELAVPYPKGPSPVEKDPEDIDFAVPYKISVSEPSETTPEDKFAVPYKKEEPVIKDKPSADSFGIPHKPIFYDSERDALEDSPNRPFGAHYRIQTETQKKAYEEGHGI